MKEKNKDRYELFLTAFENQIRHLIIDANCKFFHEFSENDESIKLRVYISHLNNDAVELIQQHFKSKYIISTGLLEYRDLICINIF